MTDKPIELDARRGMAAQHATDLRRMAAEVEADRAGLRRRQDELERRLLAHPAFAPRVATAGDGGRLPQSLLGRARDAG